MNAASSSISRTQAGICVRPASRAVIVGCPTRIDRLRISPQSNPRRSRALLARPGRPGSPCRAPRTSRRKPPAWPSGRHTRRPVRDTAGVGREEFGVAPLDAHIADHAIPGHPDALYVAKDWCDFGVTPSGKGRENRVKTSNPRV